jgi:hypothetical protein
MVQGIKVLKEDVISNVEVFAKGGRKNIFLKIKRGHRALPFGGKSAVFHPRIPLMGP